MAKKHRAHTPICRHRQALLVKPPSDLGSADRGMSLLPPLGLAYIGAVLRSKGFSVRVVDCDVDDILEPDSSIRLVGVGPCLATNFWATVDVARKCKRLFPQAQVVIGGPHLTLLPLEEVHEVLSRFPFIDYVSRGDGEVTIERLASGISQQATRKSAANRILEGTWRGPLDAIPFPYREPFEEHSSLYAASARRGSHRDTLGLQPHVMIASRGCPHRCIFCCSGKPRRIRSSANIVQEMLECRADHGARFFIFFDDLFCDGSPKDIERIRHFCSKLLTAFPEALWEMELRADGICCMGTEVLALMYRAGCRAVNIGFEKGYQTGLDFLRKDITVENLRSAVAILRAAGDYVVNGSFIIGGLNETTQEALQTIEFACGLGLDHAVFAPLTVHPGTPLHQVAKAEGCVKSYWESYAREAKYPLFTGAHLNEADALSLVREAYKRFYFRKDYLQQRLRRADDIDAVLRLVAEYRYWLRRAEEPGYYIDRPASRPPTASRPTERDSWP